MSKRQPTIQINDETIARDEIVEFVDLKHPASGKDKNRKFVVGAVKLVNGKILPLPPHKISSVIAFFYQNEL